MTSVLTSVLAPPATIALGIHLCSFRNCSMGMTLPPRALPTEYSYPMWARATAAVAKSGTSGERVYGSAATNAMAMASAWPIPPR